MTKKQYNSYQNINYNLSEQEQLIIIYDSLIAQVKQTIKAIENKRYDQVFNITTKSYTIILGLIECLDFEKGKETAKALYNFYNNISLEILHIQHEHNLNTCNQVILQLSKIKLAWEKSFKEINKRQEKKSNDIRKLSDNPNKSIKSIQIDI